MTDFPDVTDEREPDLPAPEGVPVPIDEEF
jgi:hypothetical protein